MCIPYQKVAVKRTTLYFQVWMELKNNCVTYAYSEGVLKTIDIG